MADPSRPRLRSSSYLHHYSHFPLINSIHRPPHLTTIKLAGTITLLILIPTALLPLTLQHFLFLKPPTPLPNFNDAATSAIPFGSINRPAKAWWSPEVADTVAKRRKAFAKAHCSEEDSQHYIATSRYTSTVITKAKAKSWQKTCSSLSPKTVKSSLYFAPSLAPPPQLLLTFPISQIAIPL